MLSILELSQISLEWMDTRDLYIDELYIQNNAYETLFITNPAGAESTIKDEVTNKFGDVYGHSNYEHFYFDEPVPITYRAQSKVSQFVQEKTGKYVNGATGGCYNYLLSWMNNQRRLPYVMYDFYPIFPYTDTSSYGNDNIQDAYDFLISTNDGSEDGKVKSRGLRPAINMAQNYNNNSGLISDDVPFVHTMQVQAENEINSSGQIVKRWFRAPTPNEILTQGNLAICYGVKGITYFTAFTDARKGASSTENYRSTYGLFDDSTNVYDGISSGLVQDPTAPQKPNKRFYAVKRLNHHIDKISSTLLQLTWRDAYSIHKSADRSRLISNAEYITEIRAHFDDTGIDAPNRTYVELGFFSKTSDYDNGNLEYFYVVNRRSLSTESRNIEITINKGSSPYQNWIVKEVGSDNSWIINKTDGFRPTFAPGEGKLFKLTPLFLNNATISGNVSVESHVFVPSNRILTVNAGTNLTFQNGSKLTVNGVLDVNGTSSNKVVFDFEAPIYSNGIKLNSYANANINNAIIKNAYRGIFPYKASLTLNNSELFNCRYALWLHTAVSGNSAYITNTKFHDNIMIGAYHYKYSNVKYSYCDFYNNNYAGIYCSYSSPDIKDGYYEGYNTIENNSIGLHTYKSNPFVGWFSEPGYNSIMNNTTFDVKLRSNSDVLAIFNWWGTSSPSPSQFYIDATSDLSYYPCLQEEPQQDQQSIIAFPEDDKIRVTTTPQLSVANSSSEILTLSNSTSTTEPIRSKLIQVRGMMQTENYSSAIKICEKIVTENSNSSLSYSALNLLHKISINGKSKYNFRQFVEDKTTQKGKKQVIAYGELLLAISELENIKDDNTTLSTLEELAKKYDGTQIVEDIIFAKFMHYQNVISDRKLAEATSVELGKQFPESELYYESQRQLGKDVEKPKRSASQLVKGNSEEEATEIPKNYDLLGNYPNPFNPSTTISYALPYSSNVELTIYDISGKVVKVFNENVQSAGYQNIVWHGTNQNGSKVSSGVYFYRFKAASLENNGKVYEKTAKLLLLK